MNKPKVVKEGLTFDDVLLIPGKSRILPRKVDTRTRLTRSIRLNIPIVSAAMDTVTEASLAIALAREGGMGIIHKNLSVMEQAEHVDRVKRSESGMITNPVTLSPDQLVREAKKVMKKFGISGLPVTKDGVLVGILTSRDLRFLERDDMKVHEVMTSENLITASEGITLEQAKKILHENRIEKLPVVDRKRRLKGLITYKDIQKKLDFPLSCKDANGRLRVGAAVGVGEDYMRRVDAVREAGVDVIVVDTAHAHSKNTMDAIAKIKKRHRGLPLIAGNIATAEAARDLIRLGVDAIKVGIGAGRDLHDARHRGDRRAAAHGDHGLRLGRLEGGRADHRRRRHQVLRGYRQSARGGSGQRHDRRVSSPEPTKAPAKSFISKARTTRSIAAWVRSRR